MFASIEYQDNKLQQYIYIMLSKFLLSWIRHNIKYIIGNLQLKHSIFRSKLRPTLVHILQFEHKTIYQRIHSLINLNILIPNYHIPGSHSDLKHQRRLKRKNTKLILSSYIRRPHRFRQHILLLLPLIQQHLLLSKYRGI